MINTPLANPPERTRDGILMYLKLHPAISVAALAKALQITSMAIRRHLTYLRGDGLIKPCSPPEQQRGRPMDKSFNVFLAKTP